GRTYRTRHHLIAGERQHPGWSTAGGDRPSVPRWPRISVDGSSTIRDAFGHPRASTRNGSAKIRRIGVISGPFAGENLRRKQNFRSFVARMRTETLSAVAGSSFRSSAHGRDPLSRVG